MNKDFIEKMIELDNDQNYCATSQCYDLIYSITRGFQIKKVVEIGTFKGVSSIYFCQAILDNSYTPEIYTIDNNAIDIDFKLNRKQKASENFKKFGYDKYITEIIGDSKLVLKELFKKIGRVDICFLDGDHSHDAVMNDFVNSKDYTNIMLLHDTLDGKTPLDDELEYLKIIQKCGWKLITFPTKYINNNYDINNGYLGLSLIIKN